MIANPLGMSRDLRGPFASPGQVCFPPGVRDRADVGDAQAQFLEERGRVDSRSGGIAF